MDAFKSVTTQFTSYFTYYQEVNILYSVYSTVLLTADCNKIVTSVKISRGTNDDQSLYQKGSVVHTQEIPVVTQNISWGCIKKIHYVVQVQEILYSLKA